ncbi:MAG: maltooligosyltrehalose trehalohydrolase [Mycobacteriales bacterium]
METFEVWAPSHDRVRVATLGTDHEMQRTSGGWWRAAVADAGPGTDYAFRLGDDDTPLPDPRSRWQPDGVHGRSRIYDDTAHEWCDAAWTGRQLAGSVLYEMHIGTFTPDGTFDAAIGRLDHLVELGVDLIEVLPVNGFNGVHNWGYDGVCWYAVHEPYGGPDGFKRFIDACHQRGVGVLLDVVYNHLGPSGAYLPLFGPYLKDGRNTWGQLVNLDGPDSAQVRRYIVDNALMWLRDYHLDGLRLDAVHALVDSSATNLLEQFAVETEALSAHLGRPLSLIAESDLNDPKLVTSRDGGGYGLAGQWDDDVHHALFATVTGERQGYYVDFGPLPVLAKALTAGFVHDGGWSTFRRRPHGRPLDRTRTPGHRFVVCLQNHDQVGNRAVGDRLSTLVSPAMLRVASALLLTAPYTPMLWMGEEWGATTPWQFFVSHPEPELAETYDISRREEFAGHGWSTSDIPHPQDPETFMRSKLDWKEPEQEEPAALLEWYRRLIALRHARPELTDPRLHEVAADYDEDARWLVLSRGRLRVAVNLAANRQEIPLDGTPLSMLLASQPGFVYRSGVIELDGESVAIVELATEAGVPSTFTVGRPGGAGLTAG